MRWQIASATALLAASPLTALEGCGGSKRLAPSPSPTSTGLVLASSAFREGSSIPRRYTCDAEDIAPPLTWTRVPARSRSLALLVEDKDAPGGAFLHWSVYDLPPASRGIAGGRLPSASAEGQNSFRRVGYGGPCPPKGDPAHHYVFALYALNVRPVLPAGANPDAVRRAVGAHTLAEGTLTALYRR
jgi:Raf kinase inhibitor-like YbhB/YbcL family protein